MNGVPTVKLSDDAGKHIVEVPIPTYYGDEICRVHASPRFDDNLAVDGHPTLRDQVF